MIQQLLAEPESAASVTPLVAVDARGMRLPPIGTACSLGRIMSATTVRELRRLPVGGIDTRRVYAVPTD